MTKICAEVVADSTNQFGDRLTSLLITFPRIILAEVNTHKALVKNTSSSRAIPFEKMVKSVKNDPFIPIAWQRHHKGMQGTEYLTDFDDIEPAKLTWLNGRDYAVENAEDLYNCGVTKQICNRMLEPYMWTTMLITGDSSGWKNFFNLRCPQYSLYEDHSELFKSKKECLSEKSDIFPGLVDCEDSEWRHYNIGQAEIHMMELAECIYDAMNESTPKLLKGGEWHIPFNDRILEQDLFDSLNQTEYFEQYYNNPLMTRVKIGTALAAKTSYTLIGKDTDFSFPKLIDLHNRLIVQDPLHASPMEHCAQCMNSEEYFEFFKGRLYTTGITENSHLVEQYLDDNPGVGWCRNFKGFTMYRHIIEENMSKI